MKKYNSYKDSGIEWIGEIPGHWEVKKFGYISYMKGRIGWQGLKQAEFTSNPEDPFLITGMNFHDGKIRWDEVYHILEERYNEAPEIQLKESDVLFTKDGTIGKLLYVDSIPYPHKASLNSHLLVLRPLNNFYNPRFIYYQLKGLPFKHHVELTKTGTTFYGITQEAMGQYKALLPSLPEQTAIANYLDRKTAEIDELIADKKRLLELYEEEKTAIINQAVTKGINPDAPMKDSGIEWLGEIPEHWEVKRLKYVANIVLGKMLTTEDKGEYYLKPYLRAANLNWLSVNVDDVKEMWFSERELNKYRLNRNDLLVSEGGEVGRTCIWKEELEECYIQNSVHKVTLNDNSDSNYFLQLFYLYGKKGAFDLIVNKISIAHLTVEKLKEIKFITPPFEEQQSIVHHIKTECASIDAKKFRNEKLIEFLTEYRTALISEVVTGKIKVVD
ncbi:restriction modification system DNA specificity domain protein [Syntrophobotulus glycolicus DSM 8271]|uniref:Restriction modification system DNA specificity domain protein n=1 Tax=Syntrophobotulus glycolicus (strain DSM 8271 / FlGlyR) TaxID=645991 RepID=F0T1T1_SYNGF|nr:restriction endonuclease subunit S [Syntrophobotulus glycolicus]ADY55195.1 restriction modification system DNA specificity domain protein [Syntrophobotulus glycolicus DSM 8271]